MKQNTQRINALVYSKSNHHFCIQTNDGDFYLASSSSAIKLNAEVGDRIDFEAFIYHGYQRNCLKITSIY